MEIRIVNEGWMSQSLLNEVKFPTEKELEAFYYWLSQSLLNEVKFPTHSRDYRKGELNNVAIPFK